MESRLKEFTDKLDEQNVGYGLGNLVYDSDADIALSLTVGQLKTLTSQECGIFAYKLAQYALFIQQQHNRVKGVERWATAMLKKIASKERPNHDKYMKYDELMMTVVSSNSYAKQLHDLIMSHGGIAQELDGISYRLAAMEKTLLDLQQSKRY